MSAKTKQTSAREKKKSKFSRDERDQQTLLVASKQVRRQERVRQKRQNDSTAKGHALQTGQALGERVVRQNKIKRCAQNFKY